MFKGQISKLTNSFLAIKYKQLKPIHRNKSCKKNKQITINRDTFGCFESQEIKRYTLINPNDNFQVQLLNYGATISSIIFPDKHECKHDIVMGFNNIEGYLSKNNPYFGASIGRFGNRIANAEMTIDGQQYKLSANHGKHQIHGGFKAFNNQVWDSSIFGNKVVMSLFCEDGEEGYPGDLLVNLIFELSLDNSLSLLYTAMTSKPTVVNFTHHSYFNLGGHDSGFEEMFEHVLCINSDGFLEVFQGIPTGKILPVCGTGFDLRVPRLLKDAFCDVKIGFDHNFCVNRGSVQEGLGFVARAEHPRSGRVMEVYSDHPGVQFYTGNFIPDVEGKGPYGKHGAFCLEPQRYPDAVHHKNFPSAILYPGLIYKHHILYKFFIKR